MQSFFFYFKIFTPTKREKIEQNLRNIYPWMYKLFKFRYYSEEITKFFVSSVKETMQHRIDNNIQRDDFIQILMQMRNTKVTTLQGIDGEELKGVENYNATVQEGAIGELKSFYSRVSDVLNFSLPTYLRLFHFLNTFLAVVIFA